MNLSKSWGQQLRQNKKLVCLIVGLTLLMQGCVEIQRKDSKERGDEAAALNQPIKFFGDTDLNDESLDQLRASKALIRGAEFYVIDAPSISFESGSKLITHGKNIIFRAPVIKSSTSSLIETFPEGIRASKGMTGRSGGQILFSAGRVEGKFAFNLRGEAGGQGSQGLPPNETLRGADGKTGNSGLCRMENAGTPAITVVCSSPTRGFPGQPGKPGFSGKPGFAGGDAGNVTFEIVEQRSFEAFIEVNEPGLGGMGGPGGKGGQPGVKGADGQMAMAWDLERILPDYPPAAEALKKYRDENGNWFLPYTEVFGPGATIGPNGPTGENGPAGNPGEITINSPAL
ncbi:MAG: hypothetical protein V4736_02375 [Bdellovibrionota bacterium]